MTDMTLDIARDAFEARPSAATASGYLREATGYWRDDMISDETYGSIVIAVAAWLDTGVLHSSSAIEAASGEAR